MWKRWKTGKRTESRESDYKRERERPVKTDSINNRKREREKTRGGGRPRGEVFKQDTTSLDYTKTTQEENTRQDRPDQTRPEQRR